MRITPMLLSLSIGFGAAACRDNTRCTIGDHLCTNVEGESVGFDGTQLRVCSDDEAQGGDEDGEFVVIEDCGAADLICRIELVEDQEFRGCLSQACLDGGNACVEPDAEVCDFNRARTCVVVEEGVCNNWVDQQNCEETGETCEVVDGNPVCVAG